MAMIRTEVNTMFLNDLWQLPVVEKAYKDDKGKTFIVAHIGYTYVRLTDGDTLIYDTETDKWSVELTAASRKFNSRYPRTTGIKKAL